MPGARHSPVKYEGTVAAGWPPRCSLTGSQRAEAPTAEEPAPTRNVEEVRFVCG
jgi:hypothetical protein